jgi:hypothetical protein
MTADLTDEQLRAIYAWIDAIPLSRPKKSIARDFSDGVLLAEVVATYFPSLVELHNYATANSSKQKIYNFETLNVRVLKKLGFTIPRNTIEDIINGRPGAIEGVLNTLQIRMARYREKDQRVSENKAESPANGYGGREDINVDDERPTREPADTRRAQASKANKSGGNTNEELLVEKEQHIRELNETVEILELKVAKLEQLIRLKDAKIQKLMST